MTAGGVRSGSMLAGGVSLAEPPEGWSDRSILIYAAPGGPDAPTIVVSRDARAPDEDFAACCARLDAGLANSLPGFALEGARAGSLNERPAAQRIFGWTAPEGARRQLLTLVDAGNAVVSVAATAPADAFEEARPRFHAVLASLRLPPEEGA